MAKRQTIPRADLEGVLIACARRCCVCFGLNQDHGLKSGQIAHIDGNRGNSTPENLAFLCLEHHDQLDSRTSQSKGLTQGEVRHYRTKLYAVVEALRRPDPKLKSQLNGLWESWGGFRSISIREVGASVYRVLGTAIDNPTKEAPNIGQFDAICRGSETTVRVEDGMVLIKIEISDIQIEVEDLSEFGAFGVGVSFSGKYDWAGFDVPELDLDHF